MVSNFSFYIRSLALALFSKQYYYDLIKHKKISGFKYIFFISLLAAIPISLNIKDSITAFISGKNSSNQQYIEDGKFILSQIPEIYYDKGNFRTEEERVYEAYNKNGQLKVLIDTQRVKPNLEDLDNAIVMSKNELIFLFQGTPLIMKSDEVFNSLGMYFKEGGEAGKRIFDLKFLLTDLINLRATPIVIFIAMSFVWFALRYVLAIFLYSFIASIFWANMVGLKPQNYRKFFRISAFSSTAVIVIETINISIFDGVLFSYPQIIYFFIHLIYIHYAIYSYRQINNKLKMNTSNGEEKP
jgi:hypothetical protein